MSRPNHWTASGGRVKFWYKNKKNPHLFMPATKVMLMCCFLAQTAQEQEGYSPRICKKCPARVYGALHKKSSNAGLFSSLPFFFCKWAHDFLKYPYTLTFPSICFLKGCRGHAADGD